MGPVTPDRPGGDRPTPETSAALDPEPSASDREDTATVDPSTPLGELLVAMRSESAAVREAAWGACYQRYHRVVWTRVFYVVRSIPWLAEPGEVAANVASEVFVGLPEAARHYREEGKAEWWLKQVAVRAALRKKEAETGRWATGKKAGQGKPGGPADPGRRYVPFEETADEIIPRLDEIEREERMELDRRLDALRRSPDPTERRWADFLELYRAGYGFKEIGERMGLTEASARNWLWKIRKHLARPLPGG
jgi:RNA polymerase sigma factor (sigma-70 family)